VIIIAGNHETPRRTDTGSVLQLFSEIEGVFVAESGLEVFSFRERDLAITCLPHAALLERQKLNLRADDRFTYNVLVVHAQVNERWVSDFGGVDLELKALSPHEWDYIALGHVHLQRVIGLNAAYSGALEHTSANIWSESSELKGFLEVALPSNKRTFHPLTSPREIVVLEPIDASPLEPQDLTKLITERTEGIAGGIEGKIVRLEIKGISRESYRNLDHRELRALRAKALNLTLDISFTSTFVSTEKLRTPGRGVLRDELLEFSKGGEVPGISHDEIAQTLGTYLAKVEAKYEAS
jgi:DNA repair exonuclease SbcCD nuclease subunit